MKDPFESAQPAFANLAMRHGWALGVEDATLLVRENERTFDPDQAQKCD